MLTSRLRACPLSLKQPSRNSSMVTPLSLSSSINVKNMCACDTSSSSAWKNALTFGCRMCAWNSVQLSLPFLSESHSWKNTFSFLMYSSRRASSTRSMCSRSFSASSEVEATNAPTTTFITPMYMKKMYSRNNGSYTGDTVSKGVSSSCQSHPPVMAMNRDIIAVGKPPYHLNKSLSASRGPPGPPAAGNTPRPAPSAAAPPPDS
mmetsp:Transcript_75761/g.231903  ORF Transcript_75761/g.231903 Transcript_75761/m.231903 type:complete len:205 (+) Transcript_75761:84-698(+)